MRKIVLPLSVLILKLIEGSWGLFQCPEGTSCVGFSQCREICEKARAGQLAADPQLANKLRDEICGFIDEPMHCCKISEITEVEICSPQEKRKIEPAEKATEVCGKSFGSTFNTRCTGCFDSSPGEYPWTSLIRKKKSKAVHCGGSLVTLKHVVTAAHCLQESAGYRSSDYEVVLGENDRSTEYDCLTPSGCQNVAGLDCFNVNRCADKSVIFDITEAVTHPNSVTDESNNIIVYDVGVITLASNAQLSPTIQPICLPDPEIQTPRTNQLVVAGWGNYIDAQVSPKSESATVLQFLAVRETRISVCAEVFSVINLTDDHMCVTSGREGSAVCMGDSGGPLARQVDQNRWELAGLVSFGSTNCGRKETVFTRMAGEIADWVRNVVFK